MSVPDPTVGLNRSEFVYATLQGRGGYRPVVGKKTKRYYGQLMSGQTYLVHKDDIAAQPQLWRPGGKNPDPNSIEALPGLTPKLVSLLRDGYDVETKEQLYGLGLDGLLAVPKMPEATANALWTLLSAEFSEKEAPAAKKPASTKKAAATEPPPESEVKAEG